MTGPHGRFILLVCIDDDDLPIEATADAQHFNLLEPYIDILRQQRQSPENVTPPVIPVYRGLDGRWRFSWLAACQDYPELAPPEWVSAPPTPAACPPPPI